MVKLPIQVPDKIAEAFMTLLRYGLFGIGTSLITKGWLPVGTDLNTIVGAVMMIITTAWSQKRTATNVDEKNLMASRLPDSVAMESAPPPTVVR